MARIASSVIDNIKALNIVDVISPHVELIRTGRAIKGLCPFHSERTPSFSIHEDKGIFKCFGCGEAGDAITFVMKFLNLEYVDAIVYLCENFGVELIYEDNGVPQRPTKDLKQFHSAVLEYAVKQLFSDTGKRALDYLYSRGFDKSMIERFELGYVPTQVAPSRFEKQFSHAIMKESGIFYDTSYGMNCFFSDRILFPIHSATGACIAFSGRTMDPNEKAKYKNSPETPIFSKRRELYNLHRAKDAMKDSKTCYITEGYFDVMRMVAAGYEDTVAIMGTAFTKEQVSQLKRYAEEYNIILDGDEAGQKAMRDSRNITIDTNIYPNVIFLPKGEDPDTFIKNSGREAFEKVLETKEDLLLYTIKRERGMGTDPNRRFNRLERIKNMLQQISDPYRREYYAQQTAKEFDVSEDMIKADVMPTRQTVAVKTLRYGEVTHICEKNLLSCLFALSEEQIESVIADLTPEYFDDREMQIIFNKVVELYNQSGTINSLVSDPTLGKAVADLIMRESHGEDIYAEAINNKYDLQSKFYEKARIAHTERLSKAQSEDEKQEMLAEGLELLQKIRQLKLKMR